MASGMSSLSIPHRPQDLTSHWLTDALRSTGAIHNVSVTSIEIESVGAGSGWMGECVRVTIEYDGVELEAPASLIAKFSSLDPTGRIAMSDHYRREVDFYTNWADIAGIRTPVAYFGSMDLNSGHHVLLLEDLSNLRHGDDLNGGSLDDALLAVGQLARMHATWWNDPGLRRLDGSEDGRQRQQDFKNAWGPCVENIGALLPDSVMRVGELLCDKLGSAINILAQRPQTLTHGDFRYDNVFFDSEPDAPGLAVFDWQFGRAACPAYDISYFFAASLSADQRRELEASLLNEYHQALIGQGIDGYDFDTFFDDCRLSFFYFIELWVLSGAYLDMSDPRGVAYLNASMERIDAILADHDIESLLSR